MSDLLAQQFDAAFAAAPTATAPKPTYDTALLPHEETAFQAQFPNHVQDTTDYDLRGAWKAGVTQDPNGHLPDTWKKPNHITFSDQSIYHGIGGNMGGQWAQKSDQSWSFTPSATNLTNTPAADMQKYFKQYETGNELILPKAVP